MQAIISLYNYLINLIQRVTVKNVIAAIVLVFAFVSIASRIVLLLR